jgi:hypothetical protein
VAQASSLRWQVGDLPHGAKRPSKRYDKADANASQESDSGSDRAGPGRNQLGLRDVLLDTAARDASVPSSFVEFLRSSLAHRGDSSRYSDGGGIPGIPHDVPGAGRGFCELPGDHRLRSS